jgi:hypothetical protein
MAASTSSPDVLAWDNRSHVMQTESPHAIASLRFMADSFPVTNPARPKSFRLSVLRTNLDVIAIQPESSLIKVGMSQLRLALRLQGNRILNFRLDLEILLWGVRILFN